MYTEHVLSKPLFYVILVISVLVCLLDVAMTVTVGALGYHSLNGSAPVSATCTAYWAFKFLDFAQILRTAFIHLMMSTVFSIILVVILISLMLKLKKQEVVLIRGMTKVFLYISASITVYGAIIPGGYYLTIYREVGNCTNPVYDSTRLLVLAICCMVLVSLSFLVWILMIPVYHKSSDPSEKYREVTNSQTEPNQQKTRQQNQHAHQERNHYRNEENYNSNNRSNEKQFKDKGSKPHQDTNENIYDSPSRKPIVRAYSKQVQGNQEAGQESRFTNHGREGNPSYVREERQGHLNYLREERPEDNRYKKNQSRFRESHVGEREQEDGLVYSKRLHSPEKAKYMESLLKESKGYLNRHGKSSVIDSEGQVQERESRGSDHPRVNQIDNGRRPNQAPEREGVLLNYIRGKYAG